MAAIAPILTVVSGVVSAVGQIAAANAQAAASEYNAKIQERNAIVAQQNIQNSDQATQAELDNKRREKRRTMAAIRAAYGASGVDIAGSPLDVLTDTSMELEADINTTAQEGRIRKRELGMQKQGHKEQAQLDRMSASASRTAGFFGAIGSVVGSAGTALTRMA